MKSNNTLQKQSSIIMIMFCVALNYSTWISAVNTQLRSRLVSLII